jgi:predicted ArsR family transcriptional regulator
MKRLGTATVPELAGLLELNPETVREHLKGLEAEGYAKRVGTRSRGRGRPEVVYGLAEGSERLFPRREGEMLRRLAEHLSATGNEAVLAAFLEEYIGARREKALARLEGLEGRTRLDAVAGILSEDGFMAEVREGSGGPELALCHCPIRDLVHATRLPCRLEVGYVRELLGGEPLERTAYIPAGDSSCSYALGAAPRGGA